MNYETLVRDLAQVQSQADTLGEQAISDAPIDSAAVPMMLAQLATIVQELRVTEAEVRILNDELAVTQQALAAERERYRELFASTPAVYLLTDTAGTIREANRPAVALLSVDHHFLVGKPLVALVAAEQRRAFRERLSRLTVAGEPQEWELRLEPRNRTLLATVSVARDHSGRARELRWLLREPPGTDKRPPADRWVLAELPTGRPTQAVDVATSGIGDHADGLRQVVEAIAGLLGADGGALAVVDQDGAVQWATATSQPAYLLTQVEQDFGEGPGVDARATGQPVAIADVRLGQRWLRLGPVAASHSVRAALAAPVRADGRTLGALTVIMATPRLWSQAEAQAISGYARILRRLLLTAADAAEQRRLAGQLQTALDSRIVIEQAKGVLMERKGLPPSQAFQVLRHIARSSRRKLIDVAAETITNPYA
jgi:PAS domain S-box-containing protein